MNLGTVTYLNSGTGVTVDLDNSSAQNTLGAGIDTITGCENLTGSNENDTLTGDENNNLILGVNGNDVIEGRSGADTIQCGAGIDTLSYIGSNEEVIVNLATPSASGGHATDDVLTDHQCENLTGSNYGDTLSGDGNDNTISGQDGPDTLFGGTGTNTLNAGVNDSVQDTLVLSINSWTDIIFFELANDRIGFDIQACGAGMQSLELNDGELTNTNDAGDINDNTPGFIFVGNVADLDVHPAIRCAVDAASGQIYYDNNGIWDDESQISTVFSDDGSTTVDLTGATFLGYDLANF